MKILLFLNLVLNVLKRLWSRKKRVDRITSKLQDAYEKKVQDRQKLKKEIEENIELKLKSRKSRYIPITLRRKIQETVYREYGDRMKEVDLMLKPNLEWNK